LIRDWPDQGQKLVCWAGAMALTPQVDSQLPGEFGDEWHATHIAGASAQGKAPRHK
jgi:hypothetical protein